jgi:hypothetical protein
MATIIGTLSHESGHYVVAKNMGYKANIHYASVSSALSDSINDITFQYRKQIEEGSYFPDKEKYERFRRNSLLISIGGPLQTLLTGTIGLILLFAWKKSFKTTQKLTAGQWFIIFITLFWLRQTANLVVWLGTFLLTKRFSYSDEIGIARTLGLPFWSLIVITGIIGIIVLYTVIFKFIPKPQRLTFILSGMAGGVAGYILWLYLLGPVLLP